MKSLYEIFLLEKELQKWILKTLNFQPKSQKWVHKNHSLKYINENVFANGESRFYKKNVSRRQRL